MGGEKGKKIEKEDRANVGLEGGLGLRLWFGKKNNVTFINKI